MRDNELDRDHTVLHSVLGGAMRILHAPQDSDTTALSLSSSIPSLKGDLEDDDDDDKDEVHSLNSGTGKVEDEQELLSDGKDAIKSLHSLKTGVTSKHAKKGSNGSNSLKSRTEKGTTSITGVKNRIATTSKTRGSTPRGKSGKGSGAIMSSSTRKNASDSPDREAEQDSPEDLSINPNHQALQTAKRDLAKMQRELDRQQCQQQELLTELRDYREKITEQERIITDLREAGSEKAQLQETVTELQTKLLEASEEKRFWMGKCHEAHRDYSRNESEIRLLRAELAERDILWKNERERKNEQLLMERDRCRERLHAAQKAVQEREEEVHELRRQLLGLKHNISTWTKTEGQVADDVFMERFTSLGHDLQNWTINHFRRAKIGVLYSFYDTFLQTEFFTEYIPRPDVTNLSEPVRLEVASTVPSYEKLLLTNQKLNVIQSIVAAILVKDIFSLYYFGLSSEHVIHLEHIEEYFRATVPPVKVNGWRAASLGLVRQASDDASRARAAGLIRDIHGRINKILEELTCSMTTETRDKGLRSIVEQAVELSRLFRVQQAQFKVHMPTVDNDHPLIFDAETMEDTTGEDDHALSRQHVECVMFPCVMKFGDETGDNVQLRNVIVKAKVCCQEQ